jgi:release factor glutamine methyltransferase
MAGPAGPDAGLTKSRPECKIVASDVSDGALEVARRNAGRLGAGDRIEFLKSDLFGGIEGSFDIIVSNPPYISRYEFPTLQKEVLMEPRAALDGGDDGLDFYRRIFSDSPAHLAGGGMMVLEIGYGQSAKVAEMAVSAGFEVTGIRKDSAGIDRVVTARWTN